MPELPEVETVCRGLSDSILHQTITHVTLHRKNLRIPFPENFTETLTGQTIESINRRSKYILLTLTNGWIWIIHLGMSGRVVVTDHQPPLQKHDHVVVTFNDNLTLTYHDPRRFGLMTLCPQNALDTHPLFCDLGVEPLLESCTGELLYQQLHPRRISIKQAIMNAHILVGVGNIYACESLFRSKILPTRLAYTITKTEANSLMKQIKEVLQEAIESGGSTLRDYMRSSGDLGYFQHQFHVYGREGKPCISCKQPIERIVQQNRSSFFCPKCQK